MTVLASCPKTALLHYQLHSVASTQVSNVAVETDGRRTTQIEGSCSRGRQVFRTPMGTRFDCWQSPSTNLNTRLEPGAAKNTRRSSGKRSSPAPGRAIRSIGFPRIPAQLPTCHRNYRVRSVGPAPKSSALHVTTLPPIDFRRRRIFRSRFLFRFQNNAGDLGSSAFQ